MTVMSTLDSILPKVQSRPSWAHSQLPLIFLLVPSLHTPASPSMFLLLSKNLPGWKNSATNKAQDRGSVAGTIAALPPDVSRAAANLVLAVLCIHCSNYIICGFNFESIFWSFYSNSMVHSHCRSPQPEHALPSMAIVVIAEIIPINLCLKRN